MKQLDGDSLEEERERIELLKQYEYEAYGNGFKMVAGIDEAGRGPLAGPVVSAAVILPQDFFLPGVDDSKKLTHKKRVRLAGEIKKQAVAWAVASVFPPYLDKVNILNATRESMTLAVQKLNPKPDFLLIDAVKINDTGIRQRAIIKGDSLSVSIACASILAKVERDFAMEAFDILYPDYGFSRHKGYATRQHIEALMKFGACTIHRESFEPVKSLLSGGTYGKQPGLFDQDDA